MYHVNMSQYAFTQDSEVMHRSDTEFVYFLELSLLIWSRQETGHYKHEESQFSIYEFNLLVYTVL